MNLEPLEEVVAYDDVAGDGWYLDDHGNEWVVLVDTETWVAYLTLYAMHGAGLPEGK